MLIVLKRKLKSHPKPLYNLTDLQQEAYQRYKMGPKETLNTIQNLYERHKVLTYPRTDSNYLTDDMVDTIKERLYALLATDYKSQVKSLLQSYSSKMRSLKIIKYRSSRNYSNRSTSRYAKFE